MDNSELVYSRYNTKYNTLQNAIQPIKILQLWYRVRQHSLLGCGGDVCHSLCQYIKLISLNVTCKYNDWWKSINTQIWV